MQTPQNKQLEHKTCCFVNVYPFPFGGLFSFQPFAFGGVLLYQQHLRQRWLHGRISSTLGPFPVTYAVAGDLPSFTAHLRFRPQAFFLENR